MRQRKKPEQSFLAKAKYELEHADELLAEKLKELKRIRAEKKRKTQINELRHSEN